jgi:hypothetical protein
MRYYIVVEGKCAELKLYPQWINCVNNKLNRIYNVAQQQDNSFFMISGNGYPQYFKIIDNAIDDVNKYGFDCLVIAVDSEEMSYSDKYNEINNYVKGKLKTATLKLIIQHTCLETWALGNKKANRKNTSDVKLLEYKNIYDVRINDPELLPSCPQQDLNRSQFAFVYLKCMLKDWYPAARYSKSNPKILANTDYFNQLSNRLKDTNHIKSFDDFLNAFK